MPVASAGLLGGVERLKVACCGAGTSGGDGEVGINASSRMQA